MTEAEQYNNPVYSSDLRDHIDRRNSVVEVLLLLLLLGDIVQILGKLQPSFISYLPGFMGGNNTILGVHNTLGLIELVASAMDFILN